MSRRIMRIPLATAGLLLAASIVTSAQRGQTAAPPAAPSSTPSTTPSATSASLVGRAAEGATLYKKVACYMCHVDEAQGGANGPRIGPDPIPFPRFVQYVRSPRGDMPPYSSKVLSDQDLADIYAFLQGRKKPPALSTIPLLAR